MCLNVSVNESVREKKGCLNLQEYPQFSAELT